MTHWPVFGSVYVTAGLEAVSHSASDTMDTWTSRILVGNVLGQDAVLPHPGKEAMERLPAIKFSSFEYNDYRGVEYPP